MELQQTNNVFYPCLGLQNFVSSYIFASVSGNQTLVRRQPAYPQQYLVFYPYEPQFHSSDGAHFQQLSKELLVGPRTKPIYLFCRPSQLIILVSLLPGSLHRLTRLPLHEILNQPFDGIDGFGSEIKSTNEQLSEAKTVERMIQILEAFLLKKVQRVKDPLPIDHIFNPLIAAPNQYSIEQLANLSCVSLRQFERQFLERIGTSPSTFVRQTRFAKAMRFKRTHPELSWTTVAFECGYFDQMHLIRDFKQFTSSTPTKFRIFEAAPLVAHA